VSPPDTTLIRFTGLVNDGVDPGQLPSQTPVMPEITRVRNDEIACSTDVHPGADWTYGSKRVVPPFEVPHRLPNPCAVESNRQDKGEQCSTSAVPHEFRVEPT